MSAAEHKAEAERLLEEAVACFSYDSQRNLLIRAQVHATLATVPDPIDVTKLNLVD